MATVTLTSSASSVSFSSIPATYRDLIIIGAGSPSAGTNVLIRVNGDFGANYSFVYMLGFSGGTLSGSATGQSAAFADTFPNGNFMVQIFDYPVTDKSKTILTRSNGGTAQVNAYANRYALTDAVTSVSLTASGQTFSTGFTFSLYGVIA